MTQWTRGEYLLSDEPKRIDVEKVHRWITTSYWSEGIPRAAFERAVRFSLCLGVYKGPQQVGFVRVISDFATFACLADLYVVPEHRHQGLGKWMLETITQHPAFQGIRRWVAITRDAHALLEKYGFHSLSHAEEFMERVEAVPSPR